MKYNLNEVLILEELYKNSLVSVNHLADILPIARQTITKVKQELWNNQFIHSSTIVLNLNRLEIYNYFIELAGNPTDSEIFKKFLPIPEIVSMDLILGDFSFLIQVSVYSKNRFREILHKIDEMIDNRLFTTYRIIQPLEYYKLGGFILDRTQGIIPLNLSQWNTLLLLKKNTNLKLWNIRDCDTKKYTSSELEKLNSPQLKNIKTQFYNKGIIRAFSIIFSKPTLDFSFKFFLRIKPKKFRDFTKIAEILTHNPHVIDLYRIDSESRIFATLRVKSLFQLKEFIFSLYHEIKVDKTFTTLVMQEIIPTTHPPSLKMANYLSNL
ncbi:MAG: hypothetical protein ACTSVU_01680 [Promethearchaeota archaeon]